MYFIIIKIRNIPKLNGEKTEQDKVQIKLLWQREYSCSVISLLDPFQILLGANLSHIFLYFISVEKNTYVYNQCLLW